jgi:hypothetical protein
MYPSLRTAPNHRHARYPPNPSIWSFSPASNGAPVQLSRLGTLKNEHGHARLEEPQVAQQRPRLLVTEWQERGGQRLTGSSADTWPGTDTSDVGNPTK